eukprot:9792921-Alexandrium_andersonii.AAC.1
MGFRQDQQACSCETSAHPNLHIIACRAFCHAVPWSMTVSQVPAPRPAHAQLAHRLLSCCMIKH